MWQRNVYLYPKRVAGLRGSTRVLAGDCRSLCLRKRHRPPERNGHYERFAQRLVASRPWPSTVCHCSFCLCVFCWQVEEKRKREKPLVVMWHTDCECSIFYWIQQKRSWTCIICCCWCPCCWIWWPCCSMAPWTVKRKRKWWASGDQSQEKQSNVGTKVGRTQITETLLAGNERWKWLRHCRLALWGRNFQVTENDWCDFSCNNKKNKWKMYIPLPIGCATVCRCRVVSPRQHLSAAIDNNSLPDHRILVVYHN